MNEKPWSRCHLCAGEPNFTSASQFGNHLRQCHSKKEGGSHVCLFGPNSMCPLLPYEGVSDRDYESHIAKCHIFSFHFTPPEKLDPNPKSATSKLTTFPKPSLSVENYQHHHRHDSSHKPNVIENNHWNIYSSSQNLTSILNDPFKPRSYYDNLFTKDWGFNFIDTNVVPPFAISKKPSTILFQSYLNKMNKRSTKQLDRNLSKEQATNCESESLVPAIFFDFNFDLENTETFVNILRLFGSQTGDDNLEMFLDSSSMIEIQKSLSEYLDVIEQDLSQQICKRSKDFFHVMSSMDLVMEKLKVSIKQVTSIRSNCKQLETTLVIPIQRNIELTRLRSKYKDILKKIHWISTVHQTQPTIQLLLSKNDYAGALDLISTSQDVVAQELSGVISFRYLKLQLMEIEKVIEQMMNEEFVKYLTAEWNRPTTQNCNESIEEEKLLSIIYGMLKLQKFNFIDTFREEAFTAIKTNVKQTVIETLSMEDNVEISRIDTNLFEQLKCLCYEKWLGCLRTVFDRLVTLLKRVNLVYNVINNGFITIANSSPNSASNGDLNLKVILQSDYYELKANLKEILCSICDFAHSRCSNIIELRVNDGSLDRLDTNEFISLIQLIDKFILECEQICGKKSPNLKLIIQIQSNKFVTRFHDERKRKLIQLLDLEQWKSTVAISEEFQSLCQQLVSCAEYPSLVEIYENFKSGKKPTGSRVDSFILLDGEQFIVVNAVINLVYMILDYCEYAQQLPFLGADFLLRLIDLLKLFNSRTSQLVLGAEALQIAGLKTISARTLIISMRCLLFILKFVPRIRDHFERVLHKQPSPVKHLDELFELYENHCMKIPDKVASVVRGVVESYLHKWAAKAPVPSASFQTISQHLSRLHDNIQDVMPRTQLIELFENIHSIVIQVFGEQLIKLHITNNGGPQHGLVIQELTFYVQSLRNLTIGPELALQTEQLWAK